MESVSQFLRVIYLSHMWQTFFKSNCRCVCQSEIGVTVQILHNVFLCSDLLKLGDQTDPALNKYVITRQQIRSYSYCIENTLLTLKLLTILAELLYWHCCNVIIVY